jgi:hypothetical protein
MNKLFRNYSSIKELNSSSIKIKFSSTPRFNFCYKYVPSKILKFQDISFHEPVCKIYEKKENKGQDKISNFYKLISVAMYTTLLFNPYNYLIDPQLSSYNFILQNLNWITNIIGQPLLFLKLKKTEKNSSIYVKNLYILKNGHQVLIITEDNSVSLINIKDFAKYEEYDDFDKIILKTFDKIFIIDIKNSKEFNEDIFSAIKMRRIVNTQSSYSNYNRLTVQK